MLAPTSGTGGSLVPARDTHSDTTPLAHAPLAQRPCPFSWAHSTCTHTLLGSTTPSPHALLVAHHPDTTRLWQHTAGSRSPGSTSPGHYKHYSRSLQHSSSTLAISLTRCTLLSTLGLTLVDSSLFARPSTCSRTRSSPR